MKSTVLLAAALTCFGCSPAGMERTADSGMARLSEEDVRDPVIASLDRVAEVASAILDGDDCQAIVTDRADRLMTTVDPDDRWAGSDNYDVDLPAFARNKQLLIRIASLAGFPCAGNLWMPVRSKPERVHLVIRQINSFYHWWQFGEMDRDMPPEMQRVFETGERVVLDGLKADMVSVLAPVRNSLGDIVGVVEVSTRRSAATR